MDITDLGTGSPLRVVRDRCAIAVAICLPEKSEIGVISNRSRKGTRPESARIAMAPVFLILCETVDLPSYGLG